MEELKNLIEGYDYISEVNYTMNGQPHASYSKFSIVIVYKSEDLIEAHKDEVLFSIYYFFSQNPQIIDDFDHIGARIYGIDYTSETSSKVVYYSSSDIDDKGLYTWSFGDSHADSYYVTITSSGYYEYPLISSYDSTDSEFIAWDDSLTEY